MKDGAATKSKIQAVALRLFVEKGVTETTTRDLAEAAGIAEGSIYRHYASKGALIADLFAMHYAAYARRLDEIQRGHRGARAKLAAMIADICALFDADVTLFRFLLLVQHQALHGIAEDDRNPATIVHRVVAAAIDTGEIGMTDAALATATIFGLVLQPATFMIYGRLRPPMSRYTADITAACERALLCRPR